MRPKTGRSLTAFLALEKLGLNAAPAAHVLREIASDPANFHQVRALRALWAGTRETDFVVPGLIQLLAQPSTKERFMDPFYAAEALAWIGPSAEAALPHLRSVKKNPPEHMASILDEPLAKAFWRIAGEPGLLLAVWEREVGWRPSYSRTNRKHGVYSFTEAAGEMGPLAAQFVPEFIKVANHPYTPNDEREKTIRALRQIDPAALDQVDPAILKEYLPRIDQQAQTK